MHFEELICRVSGLLLLAACNNSNIGGLCTSATIREDGHWSMVMRLINKCQNGHNY